MNYQLSSPLNGQRFTLPPFFVIIVISLLMVAFSGGAEASQKRLAYIVSDLRIPFWEIMKRGIEHRAGELGYKIDPYSADNSAKQEIEWVAKAIKERVDGIIISPTNSSAAVTLLRLAQGARIPVVIADIGSDGGEYVSYIASDNFAGSYQLGKLLVTAFQQRQWDSGSVGIIGIPQTRANGKARTAGFMKALNEAGIKGGDLRQQVDFSYQETYDFSRELIAANPELRALWLQGSDRYQGALDAIAAAGKQGEILLLCFDAEPEFLDLIPQGTLVGAGMQQPFLIGEEAVDALDAHLKGQAVLQKRLLPVLPVSAENIKRLLPVIQRNVLGLVP
ncbi:MAG: substrate-binding domain-containing protein [Gammaproteobacteria bacterium]|nr:substrate-binding domain-containing protein [Gammaproteobacteria bacterium]